MTLLETATAIEAEGNRIQLNFIPENTNIALYITSFLFSSLQMSANGQPGFELHTYSLG